MVEELLLPLLGFIFQDCNIEVHSKLDGLSSACYAENIRLEDESLNSSYSILRSASHSFSWPHYSQSILAEEAFADGQLRWSGWESAWDELQAPLLTSVVVGNEVGDPLYQELGKESSGENRTPMLKGVYLTPEFNGWQAHAGFLQIDHFSYYNASNRKSMIKGAAKENFAWFGDNIPPYSVLQAGFKKSYPKIFSVELEAHDAFIWKYGYSGQRIPLEDKALNWELGLGSLSWQHQIHSVNYQRFSDSLLGEGQYSLGALRLGNEECFDEHWAFSWQYGTFTNSGNVPWHWDEGRANSSVNHFTLENRLQVTEGILMDTKYGLGSEGWQALVDISNQADGNNSWENSLNIRAGDILDPMAPVEENVNGQWRNLRLKNSFMQGNLLSKYELIDQTLWNFTLLNNAWTSVNEPYFFSDSVLVESLQNLRIGEFRNVDGWLYGFTPGVKFQWNPRDYFSSELTANYNWMPEAQSKWQEYLKPKYFVGWGANLNFPSNLNVSSTLSFQSSSQYQYWGDEWKIPAMWNWSVVVIQHLLDDKMELFASFLDIISKDNKEHPWGHDSRFRIITGLNWSY